MQSEQTNHDSDELKKFAVDSSEWWQTNGTFKTLHQINPLRVTYIQQRCQLADRHVLDVGCGGGILADALAMFALSVTGIDLNASAIQAARDHNQYRHVDYHCCSATEVLKQEKRFDVLVCMELLEHIPDPASLVTECSELVRPGGHVFFSTIHRSLSAYFKVVVAAEYLLKLLPKGTHDYARFIQPAELARWCRHAGLLVADVSGMDYSPFRDAHRLTTQPVCNYLLHAIKPE